MTTDEQEKQMILQYVADNPRADVVDIADGLHMPLLRVERLVEGLLQVGMVEYQQAGGGDQ